MRKEKIDSLKTNRGITLIALVITIIVLLILAGIAISMLTGENGILNQAVRAKEETEKKSIEEAIHLATLSAMTNANNSIDETELEKELTNAFGEGGYTLKGNSKDGWTVKVNAETYTITSEGDARTATGVEKLKSDETKAEKTEMLEDLNGDKIVIPENFNIAKDSPTEVIEGIVIEDSNDNQYVWIPVFKKSTERTWGVDYAETEKQEENSSEYYNAIETALKDYTKNYKGTIYSDEWYGDASYGKYGYYDESDTQKQNLNYYTNGDMAKDEYETLYHNMLKSVYKNGGFYIGRYEMGTAVVSDVSEAQTNTRTSLTEYKSSIENEENEKPTIAEMPIPVSKANAVPYNYITQSQAEMLAEKLGQGEDYSNVYTSIMFGVQWDAVCVFIEHYDTNNKQPSKSDWLKSNTYGNLWGNYSNSTYKMDGGFYNLSKNYNFTEWKDKSSTSKSTSESWLCTTGAVEKNSSLNIYDFGGNVSEWTLEKHIDSDSPCTCRGSYFIVSGATFFRDYARTFSIYGYVSSRSTLYIK